jgi:hypothetical protein
VDETERVKPDIFIATLLDDIRHEISMLKKIQESMIEEGVIETINPRTVTTSAIIVVPPYVGKPWFGVKITNDGPATVWANVNTEKSIETQILVDETWGPHFQTAVITDIRLWTESGTATVRIRGER